MIDASKYFVRQAELKDVNFIATTIIEAEKSGTGNCGLANFYEMTEAELKECIIQILEEEIDGCEFSLSSFMVVDYEGEAVAASAAWIEGDNEEHLPSSILKANLLKCYIPIENFLKSLSKIPALKDLQIEREMGAVQGEYLFVKREHRGYFLPQMIDDKRREWLKQTHPEVKKSQYHIFENNKEQMLFVRVAKDKIVRRLVSNDKDILDYYPYNVILLVEHYYNF